MLTLEEIEEIEAEFPRYEQKRAACIEALKTVQRHRGWVSDEALGELAQFLEMTPAELDHTKALYAGLVTLVDKWVGILLDRIRASYDKDSGTSDREAYQKALDAEILLLDDLGAHRVTSWVEDVVTSVITYRCNHRKPLIATTNLPEETVGRKEGGSLDYRYTLPERIGSRAYSRLFEMCRVIRMPLVEDYRMKTAR